MTIIFSSALSAEVIGVPNQFFSGTKALASEVNENFDVLVNESNSQDTRIAALEASAMSGVMDQLVCRTPFNWLIGGAAYHCVSLSDPENVTYPTYVDIANDGWVVSTVGGDGGGDNIYVFSK